MGNTIKNWEKQRRREEKQMQQEIQTEVMGYFMSKQPFQRGCLERSRKCEKRE